MPYTYKITYNTTGQFYFGSRHAEKVLPEDDLWKIYFTSSKEINFLLKNFGKESFSKEILYTGNSDECFYLEQSLIKENIIDVKCLNKHYFENNHPVFLHTSHSDETKKRISDTLKGRQPSNKGKPAKNKGIPMSDEQKRKLSEAHKGKQRAPRSEETKRKISETRKLRNFLRKSS